jgi:hypothetical protein
MLTEPAVIEIEACGGLVHAPHEPAAFNAPGGTAVPA